MPFVNKIEVTINGEKLSSFTSFSLQQNIFSHHTLEIVCRRDQFEEEGSLVLDKSDKMLGSKVILKISTADEEKSEFNGIITSVRASKTEGSFGGDIIISAESPDILLDDGEHCRSFEEKKLEDIVKQVFREYQLDTEKVQTKNASEKLPYTVQYRESSWDFIKRLAIQNGQWFFYNGSNLVFGELQANTVKLKYGRDLSYFDFSLKLDDLKFKYLANEYLKNEVVTSDSSGQKVDKVSDKAKVASDKSDKLYAHQTTSLYNQAVTNPNAQTQLDNKVKLTKSSISAGLVSVTGSSDNPALTLGGQIQITESIRKADNSSTKVDHGKYIITSLSHSSDRIGNYENHFTAIPVEVAVPPYSSPHAIPFCETQSAKVMDNNDPEKLGRLRVQFAWQQDENMTSPWIRGLAPYAGKEKGVYFIPEIDEEVLVGFEGGNAEKPYLIGSLWNGKDKPDTLFDPDNNIKMIRTRSGHTIEFNDKDGNEELKIYDYNKENYIITLASYSKEIKVESKGDIQVKADGYLKIVTEGNIDINSKGNMSLESKGDFKIKGSSIKMESDTDLESKATNIKSEANAKMQIKAGATMDVQASAKMSINGGALLEQKGALVKIN